MTSYRACNRRAFLQASSMLAGSLLFRGSAAAAVAHNAPSVTPKISAHLWIYASKYPPAYDATPDLDQAFSDLGHSGFDGVELMAVNLKHDDAVERIQRISDRYKLPITGSSFGADMWDATKQESILKDVATVIARLGGLGGNTFGLSVGNAKRIKTEAELDAQVVVLKQISKLCEPHGIVPNLHNHTYEVENGMHDLKGTLSRLPDFKLGPDFNWMIRGGVDPVGFISAYRKQIVYMHLRDQYADGTWTEYLGQGVTDFTAISAALKANQFKGRAGVELAFPAKFVPQNPLSTDWKRSRDYVRTTFGW